MKDNWFQSIPCYVDSAIKENPLYVEFKDSLTPFLQVQEETELYRPYDLMPFVLTSKRNVKNYQVEKVNLFLLEEDSLNLFDTIDDEDASGSWEVPLGQKWSEFRQLIYFVYRDSVDKVHQSNLKIAKKSLKYLSNRIKSKQESFLDSGVMARDLRDLLVELLDLEEAVFSSVNFEQAKKEMTSFLSEKKLRPKTKFYNDNEVNDSTIEEYDFFLPLTIEDQTNYFIGIKSNGIEWEEIFAYRIYQIYHEYLNKYIQEKKYDVTSNSNVWEDVFINFPFPMALFNRKGDLIKHNVHFINLGILGSDCLKLKDKDKLTLEGRSFEVNRSDVTIDGEECFIILFHSTSRMADKELMPTNEELGIVTSSIAHELNNPLAGILAAVEVLFLEDNLSQEQISELGEIKKGTLRCKQLVETFLGFSKAKPENLTNSRLMFEKSLSNNSSIRSSFNQALDLIRFRLIENNIKLVHQYAVEQEYGQKVNGSIFAMIFYLLFGELITLFSHYQLIAERDLDRSITLNMLERSNCLLIKVEEEFLDDRIVESSKLIGHLLNLENHELIIDKKTLIIQTSSQLSL